MYGLHNIRFYSPFSRYFTLKTIENHSINFDASTHEFKSMEILVKELIKLFPSNYGTISIQGNSKHSLFTFLLFLKNHNKQRNDLKVLSGLLFFAINKDKPIRINIDLCETKFLFEIYNDNFNTFNVSVEHYNSNLVNQYKETIETLKVLLNSNVQDDLLTPCIIIKAYITYYLDNILELTHFYDFYKEIQDNFKINNYLHISNDNIEEKLKDSLGTIVNNGFNFPYEESEELPYALVPIDDDTQKYFNYPIGYWNCVENSLYHFLNCILWDGDNNRYIKINPDNPCIIDKIFSGTIRGTPEDVTIKLWNKLVQNLPYGRHADQINEYKKEVLLYDEAIKHVFYVQQLKIDDKPEICYNYEVETGLINFIKILEILTDKKGILINEIEPALIKNKNGKFVDINFNALNSCIHNIITQIVGSENSKNFEIWTSDTRYKCEYARKDIFGEFWFKRKYPKKCAIVEFMLSHEPGHAYVMIEKICKQSITIDKCLIEALEASDVNPTLGYLNKIFLESYSADKTSLILNLDHHLKSKPKGIHDLMIGFRLEANNLETNMLFTKLIDKYMLDELDDIENEEKIMKAKVIALCSNVLQSMPIYDPKTLKESIYSIYMMKYYLNINEIIVDELKDTHYYLNSRFSYKILNDSILLLTIRKFNEIILQEFNEISSHTDKQQNIRVNSEDRSSKLRRLFNTQSNLLLKKFKEFFEKPKISIIELNDSLDNFLLFICMFYYSTKFSDIFEKKIRILDYYLFMEMLFSKTISRKTLIGLVGKFIKSVNNHNFIKIYVLAKTIQYYEKEEFSNCVDNLKEIIRDFDLGVHILLSCEYKDNKENQFMKLMIEASNGDKELETNLESIKLRRMNIISKKQNDAEENYDLSLFDDIDDFAKR